MLRSQTRTPPRRGGDLSGATTMVDCLGGRDRCPGGGSVTGAAVGRGLPSLRGSSRMLPTRVHPRACVSSHGAAVWLSMLRQRPRRWSLAGIGQCLRRRPARRFNSGHGERRARRWLDVCLCRDTHGPLDSTADARETQPTEASNRRQVLFITKKEKTPRYKDLMCDMYARAMGQV